jgi:AraC-like DNA-binding protein
MMNLTRKLIRAISPPSKRRGMSGSITINGEPQQPPTGRRQLERFSDVLCFAIRHYKSRDAVIPLWREASMTKIELSRFQVFLDAKITSRPPFQRAAGTFYLSRVNDSASRYEPDPSYQENLVPGDEAAISSCGKQHRRMLQRVLDRMNADLATDLDLTTLAAESRYSRSHFLRTFRTAMGCSPHQWLTRLRVEKAKTILRETSISLIDIALDCGFSSHGHFSNTFRQIVGVTPSEYRRIDGPIMKKRFLFATSSFGRSISSE